MKLGIWILLSGLALGWVTEVTAAPPDFKLWLPHRQAQRSGWEWAAIGEMALLQVAGNSPAQCQMVEQILNAPEGACCKTPPQTNCTQPGHFPQLDALWTRQGRVALPLEELPSAQELYAFLRMEQVLVVELSGPQKTTRLMTLKAMRYRTTPQGETAILTLHDPALANAVEMPYPQLAQTWLRGMLLQ